MTEQQKAFRKILDNHSALNKVDYHTSNDFHTIWNAMSEYIKSSHPINDVVNDNLNQHVIDWSIDGDYQEGYLDGCVNGWRNGCMWLKEHYENLF